MAGRDVPAYANGVATVLPIGWCTSFISMAGLISTMGYAGSVYLIGWTGGFVLLALYWPIEKVGTLYRSEFVGDRYSNIAR